MVFTKTALIKLYKYLLDIKNIAQIKVLNL